MNQHFEQMRSTIFKAINSGAEVLVTKRPGGEQIALGRIDKGPPPGANFYLDTGKCDITLVSGIDKRSLQAHVDEIDVRILK